jgi:hypothetical protein
VRPLAYVRGSSASSHIRVCRVFQLLASASVTQSTRACRSVPPRRWRRSPAVERVGIAPHQILLTAAPPPGGDSPPKIENHWPSRPVGVVARRLGPRLVNTKAPCSCLLFSPHSGIGKRKSHCTTCSPVASLSQPLGELHCDHNKRENHARQARSTDRTVEEKLDQTQLKHQRMRSKALKAK